MVVPAVVDAAGGAGGGGQLPRQLEAHFQGGSRRLRPPEELYRLARKVHPSLPVAPSPICFRTAVDLGVYTRAKLNHRIRSGAFCRSSEFAICSV